METCQKRECKRDAKWRVHYHDKDALYPRFVCDEHLIETAGDVLLYSDGQNYVLAAVNLQGAPESVRIMLEAG